MSTILPLNLYPVNFDRLNNNGFSDAAKLAQKILLETNQKVGASSIILNPFGKVHAALDEVYSEYSHGNWDGYGAKAISSFTYEEAKRFIDALPHWVQLPEIVPEPTGDIGFEWSNGKDYIFVVSVDGNNKITYAGLFGKVDREYGTKLFNDAIPKEIIESIKRVFL